MTESKDNIFEYLKHFTDHKEETDRGLVQIETRLEGRITEVKTDLKSDIMQVKTDLEKDIREVKTDLKADIQVVREDIKDKVSGLRWFIGIAVAIAAIIVPLILKYL